MQWTSRLSLAFFYSFSLLVTLIIFASCNGGGGGEQGGDSSSSGGAAQVSVSAIANTEAMAQVQSNLSETKEAIKNDPTEAARAISSEELNAAQGEANLTEDDIAFLTSLQEGE